MIRSYYDLYCGSTRRRAVLERICYESGDNWNLTVYDMRSVKGGLVKEYKGVFASLSSLDGVLKCFGLHWETLDGSDYPPLFFCNPVWKSEV